MEDFISTLGNSGRGPTQRTERLALAHHNHLPTITLKVHEQKPMVSSKKA